jgi:hypothetical protein
MAVPAVAEHRVPKIKPLGFGGELPAKNMMLDAIIGGTKSCAEGAKTTMWGRTHHAGAVQNSGALWAFGFLSLAP